jgi:hypothetical protein
VTDRKGNNLAVGDRVYVQHTEDIGGPGYLRAFAPDHRGRGTICRVDDGKIEDTDICTSKSYTWSAWCESAEVEKI